jgi:hypothetical protein
MTATGMATVAAGVTILVSGACLVVFFATEREGWGRANDATTAAFAVLMIPAVVQTAMDARPVMTPIAILAVAGLCTIAVTSALTAVGRLDWLRSAKIGGIGFAALAVWIGAVCVGAIGVDELPASLGWFGLVMLAIVAVGAVMSIGFIRRHGTLVGEVPMPAALTAIYGAAFVCLPAWTIWFGLSL